MKLSITMSHEVFKKRYAKFFPDDPDWADRFLKGNKQGEISSEETGRILTTFLTNETDLEIAPNQIRLNFLDMKVTA